MSNIERIYKEIIAEIRSRIESYKENGLPFKELENILNSTISNCENECAQVKSEFFQEDLKDAVYKKYYDVLYNVMVNNAGEWNTFMFITFAKYINKIDTTESLDEFVQDAINYLRKTSNMNKLGNNIDFIFESILILILEEFKLKSSSELLKYIKQSSELCYYLNRVVSKSTKFIQNEDISIIVNRESSEGEIFPYLEEDLLKILARELRDQKIVKKVTNNVKALEEKLAKKDEEIKSTNYKIIGIKKKELVAKQHLKKGLLNLFCSIGVLSGVTGIVWGLYKPFHKVSLYDTCITTYDKDGNITTESDQLPLYNDGVATYVYEYDTWGKKFTRYSNFSRNVKEYDVSHISYEDLANYLLLDLEKLGIKSQSYSERKEALSPEDLYSEKYYEVKKYTQDLSEENIHVIYPSALNENAKDHNEYEYIYIIICLFVLAIGSFLFFCTFSDSLEYLNYYKKKINSKEAKEDLLNLLNEYKKANMEVEEIKDKLWEFYNKYCFLLEMSEFKSTYLRLVREKEESEKI